MSDLYEKFKPPFELNKEPRDNVDRFLVECLKDEGFFSFLSCESRGIIGDISGDNKNLQHEHDKLLNLWPLILTDALQELKRHDNREYDKNIDGMDSFFDPASLGTNELKEVLAGFSEFESMLYGASPERYRDHVAHSFRVWIIGHGVLQQCFDGELGTADNIKIAKSEWSSMWAIVALCHDIGYPLSHIEKINDKARGTLKKQGLLHGTDLSYTFSPQMAPFHDTIIRMMSSDPIKKEPLKLDVISENTPTEFYTHLQNKYYLKFLKSFDKLDHGIISSLLLSRSLVYFLESDYSHDSKKTLDEEDIRQFYIRREILRAIASHTCQDIYHLTFDNLSVLLYLVDEIQCWGRPTLEQSQHVAFNVKEGHAEIKSFSENSIDIRITTNDEEWKTSQQRGVLSQILKLRKMLRLALDRKLYTKKQLCFEVVNKDKKNGLRLVMKNDSLKIYHCNFEDEALRSVPKLLNEIEKYTL